MEQLLPKFYTLNVIITKKFLWFRWKKTITLTYGQATMADLIDFSRVKTNEDIVLWTIEFINKYSKGVRMADHSKLLSQIGPLYDTIKDTFWKRSNTDTSGSPENAPYSSYIAFLAKELCDSPRNIINNYSLESLDYLTEGVIWNLNEQTDEGRNKNRLSMIKKGAKDVMEVKKSIISKFLVD